MDDLTDAIDVLYTDSVAEKSFGELLDNNNNKQISDHSMNEQSIMDKVKEKIKEFKEYNGIGQEPELISDNNSQEALPDELSKEDNIPITDKNSDRALPDELAENSGVPISKASHEPIHAGDTLVNEDVISTHNSDAAMNLPHLNNEPISTHNSSRFEVKGN